MVMKYVLKIVGVTPKDMKWLVRDILETFSGYWLKEYLPFGLKERILRYCTAVISSDPKCFDYSNTELRSIFRFFRILFSGVFSFLRYLEFSAVRYNDICVYQRIYGMSFYISPSLIYNYHLVNSANFQSSFRGWMDSFAPGATSVNYSFIINKFFINSFNTYFSYSSKHSSTSLREITSLAYNGYFDTDLDELNSYLIPIFSGFSTTNFGIFQNYAQFNSLYAFFISGSPINFSAFSSRGGTTKRNKVGVDSHFHYKKDLIVSSVIPGFDLDKFEYFFRLSSIVSGAESFNNYLFTFSYEDFFRFSDFLSISYAFNAVSNCSSVPRSLKMVNQIKFTVARRIICRLWTLLYSSRNFFFFISNYYASGLGRHLQIFNVKDVYYDAGGGSFGLSNNVNFDRITRRILYSLYKNLLSSSAFELGVFDWVVDDLNRWYSSLNYDFRYSSTPLTNMHSELLDSSFDQLWWWGSNFSNTIYSSPFRVNYDLIECFFEYELHIFVVLSELLSLVSRDLNLSF